MTKRIRKGILTVFAVLLAVCLVALAVLQIIPIGAFADDDETVTAQNVSHSTVAVHDPSIVLAYEDGEGNTYPSDTGGGYPY